MNRFRIALLAVATLVVGLVVLSVVRPPMPPSISNSASAAVLPTDQRVSAPEFTGLDGWLNTSPLTLSSLHGHVVLVDFWTFSCVNCVRTLPHLAALYTHFKADGFVIVGVHSPEFDFEKDPANVAAAVHRLGVTWPVALDSQMATWNAYSNQYWPAEYLVDAQGRIAYVHYGEGDYDTTASAVAELLGVAKMGGSAPTAVPSDITPELYAGSERGQLADGESYGQQGVPMAYPDAGPPAQGDAIQVTGSWVDQGQYLQAASPGHVRLRFHADTVYVVAGTAGGSLTAAVRLDGASVSSGMSGTELQGSSVAVPRQDLFALLQNVPSGQHLIDLAVPAGFRLYTFTFG